MLQAESPPSLTVQHVPAETSATSFEAVQKGIAADKSLQFEMRGFEARPPQETPDWLLAFGRFLSGLAPLFQFLFYAIIAVVVAGLLWFILREVIRIRLPQKKAKAAKVEEDWRPAPEAARALLEDADALATAGRYDEAVHLILLRSINDIDGRLPNTVRPALTARDIGGLHRLPEEARPAFHRIAQVVEASLFGGATVDRRQFEACRQAYEDFALPKSWSAAA